MKILGLKNAKEHISNVACIKEDRIVEYSPTQDELNIEGREYNILVKGDASSGSSLLGTSIQTALLYTRLQTPRSSEYPQGLSRGQAEHHRFLSTQQNIA